MNSYAANTDGLKKTDFEVMRLVAFKIVDDTDTHHMANFLSSGGVKAGSHLVEILNKMEQTLGRVNFNAFDLPEKESILHEIFVETIRKLTYVYLVRSAIRQRDLPLANSENFSPIVPDQREARGLLSSLVDLAQQKDKEYGASWCKRGGIGAWFTTVRKFDRMITQLANKGNNLWDVSDEVNSTESLEETIKDGVNYLMLILEKRSQIAGKLTT